jgi:hypothetical protein
MLPWKRTVAGWKVGGAPAFTCIWTLTLCGEFAALDKLKLTWPSYVPAGSDPGFTVTVTGVVVWPAKPGAMEACSQFGPEPVTVVVAVKAVRSPAPVFWT